MQKDLYKRWIFADKKTQGPEDTVKRRSESPAFTYELDCVFCEKLIPEYMFRSSTKKYLAYKVRTKTLQESVKTKCLERNDSWGKEVLARIEFSADLIASDCVYHQRCSVNFRTDREKDADDGPPAKREKTGRSVDISREDAFLQAVNYFEENDEEQLTVRNLVEKMGEFSEEPFSVKHTKRRLQEYFGDKIIFSEINGTPNIVTARSTASKILQYFYNLPKEDDIEKQKRQIIETAVRLIQSDIKSKDANKDIYPTSTDMSTVQNCLEYLPDSLQLFLNKLFVGKDTKLKEAAIGHCIVQAVRPRAVIAPLQLGLAVQLHLDYGSRFLIDTLSELGFCSSYSEVQRFQQSASVSQRLDIPGFTPDQQFMQFVADNVDHNTRTLDGLNTFHGMGIIVAVTPAVKSTRIVPRVQATAEDVAAVGKIDIHFYKGRESSSGTYKSLPGFCAEDPSYSIDLLWKISWLLRPRTPLWNGTMQLVHKGEYPGKSSVLFLPMIDLDPSNESCVYSTLCFVADQAGKYGATPVVTFDQPLWMKAQQIVDSESSTSRIKQTVVRLGGFHMQMSFLGSIGHIMSDTGLKELFEVIYADNTVPHMLSEKAIARALRAHTLLELSLYALIISELFEVPLKIRKDDDKEPGSFPDCSNPNESVAAGVSGNDIESSIVTIQEDRPVLQQAVIQLEHLMRQESAISDIAGDEHVVHMQEMLVSTFRNLQKSRTSKLWIQYIEMLDILRMFIKAERTSNWLLRLQAVSSMLSYFAASGHNAYTKSAYIYLSNMADLKDNHPIVYDHFMNGFHSVRRSDRFWAGLSTDLIIEQMLMRSIMSVGGLTRGRGMDESQRAMWILSRPACSEINEAMQELSGKKFASSEQHKDCSESRMNRDDGDVQRLVEFLEERNPFSEDADLRSIATGVVADKGVNVDEARKVGQKVIERMVGKPVSEFSFKKKEQVVLMNDSSCVKIEGAEVSVHPQLLFQRLISAAQGSVPVDDLDTFFSYELCTYPPSLFENVHLLRESKKS